MKYLTLSTICMLFFSFLVIAQSEQIKIVQEKDKKTINIYIGEKLFTSFLYPDTLEKPVLYPIYASNGKMVTRGFPIHPLPGEPDDHPHHLGLWLNYENVNGLDFWNNSFAIPTEKKNKYGWIKTNDITGIGDKATSDGYKVGFFFLSC